MNIVDILMVSNQFVYKGCIPIFSFLLLLEPVLHFKLAFVHVVTKTKVLYLRYQKNILMKPVNLYFVLLYCQYIKNNLDQIVKQGILMGTDKSFTTSHSTECFHKVVNIAQIRNERNITTLSFMGFITV